MSEGPVSDLSIEILKDIRSEVRGVNTRLDHLTGRVDHLTDRVDHLTGHVDQLTGRVDHLTGGVDQLERATIEGFSGVHKRLEHIDARLDNLRDTSCDRWRDHEERIARLERTPR